MFFGLKTGHNIILPYDLLEAKYIGENKNVNGKEGYINIFHLSLKEEIVKYLKLNKVS